VVVKISGASQALGRCLLQRGPSTAADLACELGMTGAGIRKHLDVLTSAGYVHASERAPYGPAALAGPRGRGRPARVFTLTAAGRAAFGAHEESLAVAALRYIANAQGSASVSGFAESLASEFATRHADISLAGSVAERAQALATALDADGFATVVAPGLGESTQICQHNCPMGDVAMAYPEICDAETEAFSQLTGVHVTRLATIAKGSSVCTTLVPHSSPTTNTEA
jgi:predicted ArsR family transcriptional regulator